MIPKEEIGGKEAVSWRPFKRVLIANRGEIALRIMRACRELGLETVAVFSTADRTAPFVWAADMALPIGPPSPLESYLRGEVIIEKALSVQAEAVHPGYGFLAENAPFAQAVLDAGLIWIGPPPSAIEAMGSKLEARRMMRSAGLPIVPGTLEPVSDLTQALAISHQIGFPILIKAAFGGGGKGMRVVHNPEGLPPALEGAAREALSAFGNGSLYMEKFITSPRHVEVQVLADTHGNVLHLYERECSIQRRHQKVIEESPAPALVPYPHLRQEMGRAAVEAARACGYLSAGTVEFLLDYQEGKFYFLEMNTRIQVEHPVTELVTGLDLVHLQIAIARGEPLSISQEEIHQNGHAIECRIYAEDPEAGFLPDSGRIEKLYLPSGPGIRVDCGVAPGELVGVYYDPMIAKLLVWAPDRPTAIARMKRALDEFIILGVRTNIPFLKWVMDHPRFQKGDYDTRFIDQEFRPEFLTLQDNALWSEAVAAAGALRYYQSIHASPKGGLNLFSTAHPDGAMSPWKRVGRWEAIREG